MKNKKTLSTERNWLLTVIASILILFGLILVILAATNISNLGWWSALIGLNGLITIAAATVSITKNDPSWILLDLIMPR